MSIIEILGIIVGFIGCISVFVQLQKNKLTMTQAIIWLGVWVTLILSVWLIDVLGTLSNLLGINRAVDVFVYVGIMILFYALYRQQLRIEKLSREITQVVRIITLKKK